MPATILFVEDDDNIAHLLQFILEREGFELRHATTGRQAIDALAGEPADLCILDAMLPQVDGFELIGHIRGNERWATVPIIMLTARGMDQDIVRAFDLGANDYIVKPFQPPELVARIRRLLAA